jgi:hypothetical protein
MDDAAKTIKFFDKMLTQFLACAKPDFIIVKSRFMKKTSMPVTKI